jgi:hypothetical protein
MVEALHYHRLLSLAAAAWLAFFALSSLGKFKDIMHRRGAKDKQRARSPTHNAQALSLTAPQHFVFDRNNSSRERPRLQHDAVHKIK